MKFKVLGQNTDHETPSLIVDIPYSLLNLLTASQYGPRRFNGEVSGIPAGTVFEVHENVIDAHRNKEKLNNLANSLKALQ